MGRALLLGILMLPALLGMPHLEGVRGLGHETELLLWSLYALLVAVLVRCELGHRAFWTVYCIACVSAVFVLLSGATLAYITLAFRADDVVALAGLSRGVLGMQYLWQFALVLAVVPLGILIISAFPHEEWVHHVIQQGKVTPLRARAVLWHRLISHTLETTISLWSVWKEEMPELLKPRQTEDATGFEWRKTLLGRLYFGVSAACSALLIGSLEPLPLFDAEIVALQDRLNAQPRKEI